MPYAVPADIQILVGDSEYLALTDRNRDGVTDAGVAEAAIAYADGIANGYLAKSPETPPIPLSTVPETVKSYVIDIAIYRLAGSDATEDQLQRYKDALRFFLHVAEGKAAIGFDAATDDSDLEYEAPEALFSRDAMKGLR